jgi:hypothetical protein
MRTLASFVLAAALAACGTNASTGAPAPTGPSSSNAIATASTGSATPSPSAASNAVVRGTGELVLVDPAAGLDALGSHRATLSEAFEGTIDGSPASWSLTTTLVVQGPDAAQRTITGMGAVPATFQAPAWAAVVAGVAYEVEDGACSAGSAGATMPSVAEELARSLPDVAGATVVGRETIAGVEVDSYTFDGLALGVPDAAVASGRLSVATTGGAVIRFSMVESGGPDLFGAEWNGKLTTTYELADIGTAAAIELPADCPAGLLDFLVPTEATAVSSGPGHISFTVERSIADAVAMVRGGSVLSHWTAGEAVVLDDQAHLAFTLPGLAIDASVFRIGAATRVEITAVRA